MYGIQRQLAPAAPEQRPSPAAVSGIPRLVERVALLALLLLGLSFVAERFDWTTSLAAGPRTAGTALGPPITNLRVLILLVIVLWALSWLTARRVPRLPRWVALPVAVWLAVVLVSAVAAPAFRLEALRAFARPFSGVVLLFVVYDLLRTQRRLEAMAGAMSIAGVAVAVIALAESTGYRPLVDWLEGFRTEPLPVIDVPRVSSTLAHPNILAVVLELTLPLVLAWFLVSRTRRARCALAASLLVGFVALTLTFSRAGVVGLLGCLGIMAAITFVRRQHRIAAQIVAAAAGLLAVVAVVGVVVLAGGGQLWRRLTADITQFRAAYVAPDLVAAQAGATVTVPVVFTNTGLSTWSADGPGRIALSYHLDREDGKPFLYNGLPSRLPADIAPGSSVEVPAQLVSPSKPGTYIIEWDGFQDGGVWFSWQSAAPLRARLSVSGESSPQPSPSDALPPTDFRLPQWSRAQCWAAAWQMFRDRPLLGVGLDNFTWQFGDYSGVTGGDACIHAHSVYLETLADSGVLGLAALLLLAGSLVWHTLHAASRSPGVSNQVNWLLHAALTAALIVWFLHGLVEHFYRFWPPATGFWLIAGLAVATTELARAGCVRSSR